MLDKLKYLFSQSLSRKILIYMLLAALLPLSALSYYTINEIETVSSAAVVVGKERLKREVISMQKTNLNNQAHKVEQELQRVEESIQFLRNMMEKLYQEADDYINLAEDLKLVQDPRGFYWNHEGGEINNGESTVFLSSISSPNSSIKRDIMLSNFLEDQFMDVVNTNPNIAAAYFVSEDSLSRIYPLLNFSDLVDRGKLTADMRVQDYPFYYTADPYHNPNKKTVWTESYFDVTDRGWMITALAPIYLADGSFKGVIGADVTFDKLAENIITPRFEQSGAYAFLVNSRGNLLGIPQWAAADFGIHRDPSGINRYEVNDIDLRNLIKKMMAGKNGSETLNLQERDRYILYESLPRNNWSLAFVIPVDEIVAPINAATTDIINFQLYQLSHRLLIAGLIIALVVTGFSFYISKKLIQPIKKLIEGSKALSQGDVDYIIEVKSKDEIGLLSYSFNEMALRLKDLIFALKKETQKQLSLNEKLQSFNKELEKKVKERTSALQLKNQELQIANEKLQKTEESRRNLIANISHDLKTPLTSVVGYIEALQDGVAETEKQQKRYLDIIHNRTKDVDNMLDDLFLLSKIQARQEINLRPVSGEELVGKWIESVSLEVENAGLKFEYYLDPDLPEVKADPDRLRRVFNNITQNAIDHTSSGKINIEILRTINGGLRINISDTGTGIPPNDLPHIFERFYKVGKKENRTGKGAGLGLAIAKEIIETHNGTISVKSKVGAGTTFSLTLP